MTQKMLSNAHALKGAKDTKDYYDAWAETYEDEVAENGYVSPERCAAALAEFVGDKDAPLLDVGCGTGVSGNALKSAGFTRLDGCDFSAEMLERAKSKGIYQELTNTDLEDPFPFEPGAYSNIAAIGVLNPGHAPATTLDEIMNLLPTGGHFVFSLNDSALADFSYEARLNEHIDCGSASLLFREYGPHLPGIGMQSNVYVLQKL